MNLPGHHLWTHFPEIKDQDMRRSRESRVKWNEVAEKCHEIARDSPLKLENFEALPLVFVDDTTAPPTSEMECPFLGKEAWVMAVVKKNKKAKYFALFYRLMRVEDSIRVVLQMLNDNHLAILEMLRTKGC